jgi:hypothetical protein
MKERKDAPHFGYDATRKTVRAMLDAMEKSLIANKNPELRARQIVSKLVVQPDMKKLLDAWVVDSFKWDPKQMEVLFQVQSVPSAVSFDFCAWFVFSVTVCSFCDFCSFSDRGAYPSCHPVAQRPAQQGFFGLDAGRLLAAVVLLLSCLTLMPLVCSVP